ncbi:MAG: Z1 domain-containing protein [Anaerovorax sp.]|nr:Z1 domain-containing protein [Anaerovorax sp.]
MIINGSYYTFKKTEGEHYSEELKQCVETTCQYCIDNTFASSDAKIKKPIMMLGKIQSGKTKAFIGLIALAFDNNFDMIFILTKNSQSLVQQTVSRMKKEFKPFIEARELVISDIMKVNAKISGYQLEQNNILVAKKEKNNINKLIEFIKNYSISQNKNCLIIDDEADTTGIGYNKIKGSDDYTLRTVSSRINTMRGTLDGCVFVEVTATPYALYLQPDFDEYTQLHAIKPMETILVPHGKEYIGGEDYFIKSKNENNPEYLLFEPMDNEEGEMVSEQKRNGKKSKIEKRSSLKIEEILENDKLPTLKKGIINFIIGTITLRKLYNNNEFYSFVIHTATQTNIHLSLQDIVESFLNQIANRKDSNIRIIETLLKNSYKDIAKSVVAYDFEMPDYTYIENEFYKYVDKGYFFVKTINSKNNRIPEEFLDEETGELRLDAPASIFVGGSILDRGVTIQNMIGFYYGRNPKIMQQDTVLQHSRMFGYRKKLLPVTRFYTTSRIHSNMEKITEIDLALREEIEAGKQGKGIYFITSQKQNTAYGKGGIRPCSLDKIRVSDILILQAHRRLLPVGFTPVNKAMSSKLTTQIESKIKSFSMIDKDTYKLTVAQAEELVKLAYDSFEKDDDDSRFVELFEFITSLKYYCLNNQDVYLCVYRDMNILKYKEDKKKFQDSPDTSKTHLKKAKELAINSPCIMLFQENGDNESWKFRPFWWPVLVGPQNVPKTMYAAKFAGEKIIVQETENSLEE